MKAKDCVVCDNNMSSWFNSMFDGFAVHEIVLDANDRAVNYTYLDVNGAFKRMMKLEGTQVVGKTATDIYISEEDIMLDAFAYVALEGKPLQFEHYFKTLNKYFRISAYSPQKGQFITFMTDITDLKNAEDTLKMHHILFENAKDIILYINEDKEVVTANRNAMETYGYTDIEIKKLKISDLRHHSTLDTFQHEMKIADENGVLFESLHVKKDGTIFPVEVSVKGTVIDNKRIRMHVIRDITERKKSEERILYLANHDILTGVANRGYLMKQIDSIIKKASITNDKFALMIFDIDKFKAVNDIHGHSTGDKVLKNIANSINSTLRKSDVFGRYGGDEFIIVQPFIKDKEDVKEFTKRIMSSLKASSTSSQNMLNTSISLGISIFPDDGDNKKDLLIHADTAMYEVKKSGGNGFGFN